MSKKLLGLDKKCLVSFVTHHFSCLKTENENMIRSIENKYGNILEEVILLEAKKNFFRFSEYDLLGRYYVSKFNLNPTYWFNKNSHISLKSQDKDINEKYISVTFHNNWLS